MAYNYCNINDYYALEKAIVPARYLLTWSSDFVRAVENFAADEDDEDAQNSVKAIVSAGAWNAGELINEVAKFKLEEATAAAKEIGCFVLTTSALVHEICEEVQKDERCTRVGITDSNIHIAAEYIVPLVAELSKQMKFVTRWNKNQQENLRTV